MRVLLALDSDEAGQNATLDHIESIADFGTSWGTPRGAGPTAQALATAQLARDTAQRHWTALDVAASCNGEATLIQARNEAEMLLEHIGRHITDLYRALYTDRPYRLAKSPEELELLLNPPKPMYDASRIDWAEIKNRVDLVDFVAQYTDLVQRGATYKGKCPLPTHPDDKTASFFVYPQNRNWNCYGCNTWGDLFDLAKALNIHVRDL